MRIVFGLITVAGLFCFAEVSVGCGLGPYDCVGPGDPSGPQPAPVGPFSPIGPFEFLKNVPRSDQQVYVETENGNLVIWRNGVDEADADQLPGFNQLVPGYMYKIDPGDNPALRDFGKKLTGDDATGFYLFKQ